MWDLTSFLKRNSASEPLADAVTASLKAIVHCFQRPPFTPAGTSSVSTSNPLTEIRMGSTGSNASRNSAGVAPSLVADEEKGMKLCSSYFRGGSVRSLPEVIPQSMQTTNSSLGRTRCAPSDTQRRAEDDAMATIFSRLELSLA